MPKLKGGCKRGAIESRLHKLSFALSTNSTAIFKSLKRNPPCKLVRSGRLVHTEKGRRVEKKAVEVHDARLADERLVIDSPAASFVVKDALDKILGNHQRSCSSPNRVPCAMLGKL